MEKLTSILAIAQETASGVAVLDKAVLLARGFGARVELLVTDLALTKALAEHCSEHVYHEVTICGAPRNSKESLEEFLLRQVSNRRPDVVVGCELVHDCPVPMLLVGLKPWSTSMRFAALVDASTPETALVARGILQAAGFLALGLRGWLDILYVERERKDERVRMERAVRLAQLVREYHVGCERLQMFDGEPEVRLPPMIQARQYDVLVLGAIGRSLAGKLFEATAGDLLLANGSMRARDGVHFASSTRQKIPHQAQELV